MPDLWMDADTALSEVPVNIMPLLDATDFKTREDALTYDQAGMDLQWNFVTTAGAFTQTVVTPTTGGDYDWTGQGNGMYTIEIPASGGASINNDTEGFGWFTGFCTGVLPWRGPTIGFRAAALNNALIDGGDTLDVNATEISGDSGAADNLEAAYDGAGYAGGTIKQQVDAVAISGDTTAADNAEAMFDGTGYAGGTVKLQVNLVSILGTALTETAGQIAAAFKKFFDVAAPTATCLSLPDAVPGAAGGLPTTNGTKVLQTVDLTAGQSIAASSVPNVTLANGAHGGAAATITLATPIVANATQIEGGDATDAIGDAVWNEAVAGHATPASYGVYLGGAPAGATLAADVADIHTDVGTAITNIGTVDTVVDGIETHVHTTDGHITADYGATEKAAIDLLDDAVGGLLDIHTDVNDVHGHVNTTDGHITADYGATEKAAIDLLDDAIAGLVDIHTDIAAIAAPSAATVADAVWNEAVADHLGVGSTGAALNAAGAAGDPWITPLPGGYLAGQAGFIVGTNLNATVSSRLATAGYTAPDNATITDIHTDVADLHVDVADVHTDVNAQGMAGSAAAPVVGTWGQLLDAVCRGDYQYNKVTNVETIMDRNGNVIANLTVVDGALMLTKT